MRWILNFIYLMVLALVSPWIVYKAIIKGKYREGWNEKLLGNVPVRSSSNKCIWLHAVSVGEVVLLKPVIAHLKRVTPDLDIVISVTTSTGYRVAKEKYPEHCVFYAPLDFSWAIDRAIARIKPDLIGLAELELWPNWVMGADNRNIPMGIFHGRLSQNSHKGYTRLKGLLRPLFQKLAFVTVQNKAYATRFSSLGVTQNQLSITGSIKFELVELIDAAEEELKKLRTELGIEETALVLMAGSTHQPEEEMMLEVYRQIKPEYPQLKFIIAPRHAERFDEIAQLIARTGLAYSRRSSGQTKEPCDIILLDTLGELSRIWGMADIAFVGGSLSNKRGGQNMLEPAAHGSCVLVGPDTRNFAEIMEILIHGNAITVCKNQKELQMSLSYFLKNEEQRIVQGDNARQVIVQNQGAASRNADVILGVLEMSNRCPSADKNLLDGENSTSFAESTATKGAHSDTCDDKVA